MHVPSYIQIYACTNYIMHSYTCARKHECDLKLRLPDVLHMQNDVFLLVRCHFPRPILQQFSLAGYQLVSCVGVHNRVIHNLCVTNSTYNLNLEERTSKVKDD
jgi:hypothetical protein